MPVGGARLLVAAGAVLIVLGLGWMAIERLGLAPGRLPGDIAVRGERTTVYFPWVTSLALSLLVTLILTLWRWWRS